MGGSNDSCREDGFLVGILPHSEPGLLYTGAFTLQDLVFLKGRSDMELR